MIKDRVTLLETAASTGGRRTLLRIELAPGGGNGLHTHDTFTETFTALEGELGVEVNDMRRVLRPGEQAVAPPKAMHCFFNASAERPALFEVELTPANAGFERGLVFVYGLAEEGLTFKDSTPKDPRHLAVLVHWAETAPADALRFLMPLLRFFGRRLARKAAYHERLKNYLDRCPRVEVKTEMAA